MLRAAKPAHARALVLLTLVASFLAGAGAAHAFQFGPGSSTLVGERRLYVNGTLVTDPAKLIVLGSQEPTFYGYGAPGLSVELFTESKSVVTATVADGRGYWIVHVRKPLRPGVDRLYLRWSDPGGASQPVLAATFRVPTRPLESRLMNTLTSLAPGGRPSAVAVAILVSGFFAALAGAYMVLRRRTPGGGRLLMPYAVALTVRVLVALPLVHDWDGFVFLHSAEALLRGVSPYATVQDAPAWIYPDSDFAMTQQWYAYPALPLLGFAATLFAGRVTGLARGPVTSIFAIKLAFIAGDLLCAWLVGKVLRSLGVSDRATRRAQLLVLFNPLLIWVSAAWGMFDIWMVNFVLLFLLALRANRGAAAGVALALAPQVKVFPVFFLPVAIAHAWQTLSSKQRVRLLVVFSTTTAALILPFLLTSPKGFMNQNLLMHLRRPPQGVGLAGLVDFLERVYDIRLPLVVPVLGLSALALAVVLNLWGVAFVGTSTRRFLAIATAVYCLALAGNKVVNEQYFVVLIALLILLGATARSADAWAHRLRRTELAATLGVLTASLVLGFHFLTFVHASIAERYLGGSTERMVFELSRVFGFAPLHSYPNSVWTYYQLPAVLAHVAVAPALVLLAWMGIAAAAGAVADLRTSHAFSHVLAMINRRNVRRVAAVSMAAAVVAAPFAAHLRAHGAFQVVDLVPAGTTTTAAATGSPAVGAFYYLWWNNPSHVRDHRNGAWTMVTQRPESGYYSAKGSYFVRHMRQMQDAGIDFAVVSHHMYVRQRFHTFAHYADRIGFGYSPLIEMGDALDRSEFWPVRPDTDIYRRYPGNGYRLSEESRRRVLRLMRSTFPKSGPGARWLRIDGRPVVFVYDGHYFEPSWDQDSKRALARRVIERYAAAGADPLPRIAEAWGEDIRSLEDVQRRHPVDLAGFNNAGRTGVLQSNRDFRDAFADLYDEFWRTIRAELEAEVGPVYLATTYPGPQPQPLDVVNGDDITASRAFDNEFYYSLSNTWIWWRVVLAPEEVLAVWDRQVSAHNERDTRAGRLKIRTVIPAYDDTRVRAPLGFVIPESIAGKNTYDRMWDVALANTPDIVLIATWNEFFEGTAIEPTIEDGRTRLDATMRWVSAARERRAQDVAEAR